MGFTIENIGKTYRLMGKEYKSPQKILKFTDNATNVKFELELHSNFVQILGNTATGRSLFVSVLKSIYKSHSLNLVDSDKDIERLKIFDETVSLSDITGLKDKIIIIDRADIPLARSKELCEHIKFDYDNNYVIVARGNYGFDVSPNNFATLIIDGGTIKTYYAYNERGW